MTSTVVLHSSGRTSVMDKHFVIYSAVENICTIINVGITSLIAVQENMNDPKCMRFKAEQEIDPASH